MFRVIIANVQSVDGNIDVSLAEKVIKTYFRSQRRASRLSKKKRTMMLKKQRHSQRKSNASHVTKIFYILYMGIMIK
jgi:hypothetical protein